MKPTVLSRGCFLLSSFRANRSLAERESLSPRCRSSGESSSRKLTARPIANFRRYQSPNERISTSSGYSGRRVEAGKEGIPQLDDFAWTSVSRTRPDELICARARVRVSIQVERISCIRHTRACARLSVVYVLVYTHTHTHT